MATRAATAVETTTVGQERTAVRPSETTWWTSPQIRCISYGKECVSMAKDALNKLVTESQSPYPDLDARSIEDILAIVNAEDRRVAEAVEKELPRIAKVVHTITDAFARGGRLIYVGAGTSGRLGVLDASECPPTFGVSQDQVDAIIAGGDRALRHSSEKSEDDPERGAADLRERGVTPSDVVVGIAASGRTPYVIGALREAERIGARRMALVCNPGSPMEEVAEVTICPVVGPEVLMGSTRMKAGSAQKMVLNMLSTVSMIKSGKAYGNLMVDLAPSNAKLVHRAKRIIQLATGCDEETSARSLQESGNNPKVAIVMIEANRSAEQAHQLLERADGFVRTAIEFAAEAD